MSKVSFIIYTLIYMAIAVLLTFKLGPAILKGGKSINTTPITYNTVEKIEFSNHRVGKEYINVKITANKTPIKLQFRRSEGTQSSLLNILKNNQLITNEDSFLNRIPVSFTKRELNFINKLEVIYTKDKLSYVAINSQTIKGGKQIIRKIVATFLGCFIIALSGLGLVLLPLGAYSQIKYNTKNGTPIYVPNRLDGIKKFFRLFSKK